LAKQTTKGRGGFRKGAGRPKGSKNKPKANADVIVVVATDNEQALEGIHEVEQAVEDLKETSETVEESVSKPLEEVGKQADETKGKLKGLGKQTEDNRNIFQKMGSYLRTSEFFGLGATFLAVKNLVTGFLDMRKEVIESERRLKSLEHSLKGTGVSISAVKKSATELAYQGVLPVSDNLELLNTVIKSGFGADKASSIVQMMTQMALATGTTDTLRSNIEDLMDGIRKGDLDFKDYNGTILNNEILMNKYGLEVDELTGAFNSNQVAIAVAKELTENYTKTLNSGAIPQVDETTKALVKLTTEWSNLKKEMVDLGAKPLAVVVGAFNDIIRVMKEVREGGINKIGGETTNFQLTGLSHHRYNSKNDKAKSVSGVGMYDPHNPYKSPEQPIVPVTDPYATLKAQCKAKGGTWNEATKSCDLPDKNTGGGKGTTKDPLAEQKRLEEERKRLEEQALKEKYRQLNEKIKWQIAEQEALNEHNKKIKALEDERFEIGNKIFMAEAKRQEDDINSKATYSAQLIEDMVMTNGSIKDLLAQRLIDKIMGFGQELTLEGTTRLFRGIATFNPIDIASGTMLIGQGALMFGLAKKGKELLEKPSPMPSVPSMPTSPQQEPVNNHQDINLQISVGKSEMTEAVVNGIKDKYNVNIIKGR
jgi:hypothetical protein